MPPPLFSPAFSSSLYTTLKLRAVQSGAAMQDVRHEHVRTPRRRNYRDRDAGTAW